MKYRQPYRFKHISTGLYLAIETHVRRVTGMHNFSKLLAQHAQHYANFRMLLAGKNDPHTCGGSSLSMRRREFVSKDEHFMLMNFESKLFLQVTKKDKLDRLVSVFQDRASSLPTSKATSLTIRWFAKHSSCSAANLS